MKKFGSIYLNDPEDFVELSSGLVWLVMQMELLDFARRYYKRLGDKTSLKRSEEIRKLLFKISEMQTQAVRALISEDVFQKHHIVSSDRMSKWRN